MNPEDVAEYLRSHPEFFERHAEVLNALVLPHPHGGRAISLAERQMMTLREKNKALELRLAELVRFGRENDAILDRLQRWTRGLLLQRNARLLPDALLSSLAEIFSVPYLGLRVWETADDYADLAAAQPVPAELMELANALKDPYLGTARQVPTAALTLLDEAPVQSIALLPLRRGAAPQAFGLLALGSADPARFDGGMGTHVLTRIGEIASAALTRLVA